MDLQASDPTFVVCGACKEGNLIPLFASKRQSKSQKLSHMAAAKTQGKTLRSVIWKTLVYRITRFAPLHRSIHSHNTH